MVKGTGKLLILNNGKLLYFCSSKCEKNTKLKRKPQRITWARKKVKKVKK
jgi:large subunit ribosomal protein L24e